MRGAVGQGGPQGAGRHPQDPPQSSPGVGRRQPQGAVRAGMLGPWLGGGRGPTLAGLAVSPLAAGRAAAVEAPHGVATLTLTARMAGGTRVHICEGETQVSPAQGQEEAQDPTAQEDEARQRLANLTPPDRPHEGGPAESSSSWGAAPATRSLPASSTRGPVVSQCDLAGLSLGASPAQERALLPKEPSSFACVPPRMASACVPSSCGFARETRPPPARRAGGGPHCHPTAA